MKRSSTRTDTGNLNCKETRQRERRERERERMIGEANGGKREKQEERSKGAERRIKAKRIRTTRTNGHANIRDYMPAILGVSLDFAKTRLKKLIASKMAR